MAETGFHKLPFDAQLKVAVGQIYGLFEMTVGHFYMFRVSAEFDANLAERTDRGATEAILHPEIIKQICHIAEILFTEMRVEIKWFGASHYRFQSFGF